VLWVAGHSGPETAEDSRTHFGIYEPGVTQLFPEGKVVDLHPWEYNEVPVVLAAALATDIPIIALHLTRPAVELPDRDALNMPSHFEAAHGAYVLRPFRNDLPAMGTVVVQGTLTTANIVRILPDLDNLGLNVKVVAAISPQLFRLQSASYRERVLGAADRLDAMAITNRTVKLMHDWVDGPLAAEYSMGADWDDRWRTGGSVDEVMDEAHLTTAYILQGITRFVQDRVSRLQRLHDLVEAADRGAT
jgi:transketolase